jgi:hypothetical protein
LTERKVEVMFNGRMVTGTEVPIDNSNEKWSEFTFGDGTVVRAKISLLSAVRIDGEFDPNTGLPAYAMNMTPTIAIMESPQALRKKD